MFNYVHCRLNKPHDNLFNFTSKPGMRWSLLRLSVNIPTPSFWFNPETCSSLKNLSSLNETDFPGKFVKAWISKHLSGQRYLDNSVHRLSRTEQYNCMSLVVCCFVRELHSWLVYLIKLDCNLKVEREKEYTRKRTMVVFYFAFLFCNATIPEIFTMPLCQKFKSFLCQ